MFDETQAEQIVANQGVAQFGEKAVPSLKFDNIFDVVTDNSEEANELQTRADLMIVIRDIYQDSGLGKTEFAEKIGLTQPRTSNLLNGHIEKFSIDLLMTCLFRLGYRFKPSYKNHRLTMKVEAA